MTLSACNILGHGYLNSRPQVLNGGLLAQILSKIKTTNTSVTMDSSLGILDYISQFFFNYFANKPSFQNETLSYSRVSSGQLTSTIFGIIYILLVLICGIILALIWTCARIIRRRQLCQRRPKNALSILPEDFQFLSDVEMKKRRKYFLKSIIMFCALCYVFLVPVVICFTVSATSQSMLHEQILGLSENRSLLSSWYQSLNHLNSFLDDIIDQSYVTLNLSLSKMSASIENLMLGYLDRMISQLLVNFGVYDIFSNATLLIGDVKETAQSMRYIKDNSGRISKDINIETGVLKTIVDQLRFHMALACKLLSVKTDCTKIMDDLTFFRVAINTSYINDHSSISMIFLLDQFQLNLTSLAQNIVTMNATLNNGIKVQIKQQIHNLNINGTIQGILSLWPPIANLISPWKDTLRNTNSSFSYSLQKYGAIFFNVTSVILFVVALSSFFLLLALTRFSIIYFVELLILVDLIESPKSRPSSIVHHHKKKKVVSKLKQHCKVPNTAVYIFIVVSSLVALVMVLLSLIVLNASHLMFNEACTQAWSGEGMLVTDDIVDVFLKQNWRNIVSNVTSRKMPVQITIPRPRRVLGGIRDKCSGNNGIFYALQMTDFVNVSAFVWTPENYKALKDGLNSIYKTVIATDTTKLIPKDMEGFINTGLLIGKYFDGVNYQPTIDELSKDFIELKNYTDWIISAIQYFSVFNDPNSKEIIRLLNVMYSNRTDIQRLTMQIATLKSNFKVIQERRTFSLYIKGLLDSISRVRSSLVDSPSTYEMISKMYSEIMLKEFVNSVNDSLNDLLAALFQNLVPCSNLSLALSGLFSNLCMTDFTLETICSYGLNMAFTSSFFMASLHIIWTVIRKDFSDRDEKNISTC